MRDIICRGKTTIEGKWTYGYFVNAQDNTKYIEPSIFKKLDDCVPECWDFDIIDINTLGQYTGFKDIQGIDVYEGDIINCFFEYCDGEIEEMVGEVVYSNGSFCLLEKDAYYPLLCLKNFVILGNIHDNPELLGDRI